MSSYRNFEIWKRSFKVAEDVYRLTSRLPKEERFGLISQIQRCAISIPSNIAEGQQRNSKGEFKQFLGIARGSAAELSTQLLLVESLYNLNTQKLVKELEEIQKMLYSLQSKLN
jgi:four helix bundle protein